LIDLSVGLSEDPDRVLGCFKIPLRGLLVGGRLIDILLRAASRFEKVAETGQRPSLQFEHAGGGEQVRFSLQQIRAIDRKQDVALLDLIPEIVKRSEDFARILGKYLDQHVLVEVDGADGALQHIKIAPFDRPDLERSGLLFGQFDGLRILTVCGGLSPRIGRRVDVGGRREITAAENRRSADQPIIRMRFSTASASKTRQVISRRCSQSATCGRRPVARRSRPPFVVREKNLSRSRPAPLTETLQSAPIMLNSSASDEIISNS